MTKSFPITGAVDEMVAKDEKGTPPMLGDVCEADDREFEG